MNISFLHKRASYMTRYQWPTSQAVSVVQCFTTGLRPSYYRLLPHVKSYVYQNFYVILAGLALYSWCFSEFLFHFFTPKRPCLTWHRLLSKVTPIVSQNVANLKLRFKTNFETKCSKKNSEGSGGQDSCNECIIIAIGQNCS